nr:Lysophospholipid acyltransferase superfamily [Oceanusvirus sp.]
MATAVYVARHAIPFLDGLIAHWHFSRMGLSHTIYALTRGIPDAFLPGWVAPVRTRGFVAREVSRDRGCARVVFPSGGRGKWKSGFYWLAMGLGVPVVPVTIDYWNLRLVEHREIRPLEDHLTFSEVKRACLSVTRPPRIRLYPNEF